MLKITALICILLFITVAASSVVNAAIPANVPCKCENGATRNTNVDYCSCTGCSSPYVLPFCSFKADEEIQIGITYNWTGRDKDFFPFERAEENIIGEFGFAKAEFNRIRRANQFEKSTEIVVEYLINGGKVNQLYQDVFASEPKSYLRDPQALNIWQIGTVVSAPGVFSKHFGTGNILARVKISDGEFVVNDRQLEFFISALVLIFFLPVIEAVINVAFHPSEEELDAQQTKYGEEGDGANKNTNDAGWEMSEKNFDNNNNNNNNNNYGNQTQPLPTPLAGDNNEFSPQSTTNPLGGSGQEQEQDHYSMNYDNSNNNNAGTTDPNYAADNYSSPAPVVPLGTEAEQQEQQGGGAGDDSLPHHAPGSYESDYTSPQHTGPLKAEDELAPVSPPPQSSFRS